MEIWHYNGLWYVCHVLSVNKIIWYLLSWVLSGECIHSGEITIGAKTSFNRNVSLNASVGGCIEIGKDCLIGPGAYLRTASHNYKNKNVTIKDQGHKSENIIIGTNVWLGANVVVLPGVTIGDGCVVAAGAVLTKSFGTNQIIGGVPAKSVGER